MGLKKNRPQLFNYGQRMKKKKMKLDIAKLTFYFLFNQ